MKSRTLLAAGAALMIALGAGAAVRAQEGAGVDEIVVTGSRISDYDVDST